MLTPTDLVAFLILSLITLIVAVRHRQIVKVTGSSPPIIPSAKPECTTQDDEDDPNKDRDPGGKYPTRSKRKSD